MTDSFTRILSGAKSGLAYMEGNPPDGTVVHAPGYIPNPNYSQEDWDEVCDNPPLTAEELSRMKLGPADLPPELAAALKSRGGRPKADMKRGPISLRVEPEVLEAFKAGGPGWQTRMNDALAGEARKLKTG